MEELSYDSGVYIRKTVQKAKSEKEYVNHLLVESVMTEKGSRQRTICSLGNLRPRPLGDWLVLARKVEKRLAGQLELEGAESDPPTTNRGTLRIRCGSAQEPEHIRIYDALGLPHTIMTPIKTWSST